MNQRIKTIAGGFALGLLALTYGTNAMAQTAARIVFQAPVAVSKRTSYNQIFSMNADGSGVVQLTTSTNNTIDPRWSPGQTYVSFFRNNALWVMESQGEANGGRSFAVAPARFGGADWSPDGSTLVFQGTDSGLWFVSVNAVAGTASTPVLFHFGYWYNPSWSPDGTKIAANGSLDGTKDIIAVFDAATGALLTTFGASSDQNFAPQWSPDGTLIAFTGPVTFTSTGRNAKTTTTTYQEIFLANPDGTGLTQVTSWKADNFFPTWSPDGTMLAFRSNASGSAAIYRMVLGSNVATWLHSGGNQPDWNP